MNPFYDSFIKWQFRKLKENGFLKFGKRPSIFSPKDKQMCADHDRQADSEGIQPQEYTLIKLEVITTRSPKVDALLKSGRKVVMVAATLRPETMYGQTNCFVLPEGDYGIYEMRNQELWVCGSRAMYNLSYQD